MIEAALILASNGKPRPTVDEVFAASVYRAPSSAADVQVKSGTYVGNGSAQNIACGFAGSARFVLITPLDTLDFRVYDTVRGISSGSSPLLRLGVEAAEVANSDLKPYVGGFGVGSGLSSSGVTYCYFAIA